MTRTLTIGEAVTIQRGTTYKSALIGQPGPVLLGLGTIHRNGGFRGDSLRTYGGDSPDKLLVRPGELYASLKDVTQSADLLGAVASVPVDGPTGRLTQDTVRLDLTGVVAANYLYWVMRTPQYRAYCRAHATGTTNLGLPRDDFFAFPFPAPTARTENLVALLGALDDKVESNRRAASLLHDLVTLQFERAVDKSPAEIVPLSEIATVTKGRSYKSIELQASETALVTLKSISRQGGYKPDGLKPYVGEYKREQVVRPGELVVAQTDLTQGAEVVGRGVRVPPVRGYETLVASLDLAIVRPRHSMPIEYLYGLLTSEPFRQHCRSRVTGTTVLHLAKDAMPTWPGPVIPPADQEAFARVAAALLARMDALEHEADVLRRLRDTLLSELLSGRIRVPDAASVVQDGTE